MRVNGTGIRIESIVKPPLGLSHVDSDVCWCGPEIEVDENGGEVVVHREIIWN